MLRRRDFLKMIGLGAVTALLPRWAQAASEAKPQLNVLFICTDDLNDWVGCLGGRSDINTPNIDRLAKRGVLFTNAHCPAPLCNPCRTAIMTGLRPSTTGIHNNNAVWAKKIPDWVTLPRHFKNNGYHVAGAGKIYHHTPKGFNPKDQWHEYFDLIPDQRWRYIRYVNGDEELYDHETDPDEWNNLAARPKYEVVKKKLARWLPGDGDKKNDSE